MEPLLRNIRKHTLLLSVAAVLAPLAILAPFSIMTGFMSVADLVDLLTHVDSMGAVTLMLILVVSVSWTVFSLETRRLSRSDRGWSDYRRFGLSITYQGFAVLLVDSFLGALIVRYISSVEYPRLGVV